MVAMNKCPVCAGENILTFMRGIFDSDTTEVLECGQCGVQFLDPMMTEDEENDYYRDYYEKQKTRHFTKMGMADIQVRAIRHYEQYRAIYSELIKKAFRILEIGSGTGGFIHFVTKYFPEIRVSALERDPVNRSFMQTTCPNVEYIDSLEEIADKSFDAIVAFGVFEHLRDGAKFLGQIEPLLCEDGLLALNVPNKANALVYDYDLTEFRKFTYMKQHYLTYTEEAIAILAEKTNMSIERFHYLQVWGLDNHLSWLRYRRPRDYSDITRLLSPEMIEMYNRDLITRKKSDLMMAVLKRTKKE